MSARSEARRYERELRALVAKRTGKEFEEWLAPQVRLAAQNMVTLGKVHDEIMGCKDLVTIGTGSTGQVKNEVNPLLSYYDKMSRTVTMQLEALGLNYNTTPSKVTENTKEGGGEADRMREWLAGA